MTPGQYDLTIHQGAALDLTLTWRNPDATLVNLTGYAARLQVRPRRESATVLLELSTTNGRITLGGAAGTIRLYAPSTVTAPLAWGAAVYDLEMVPPAGEADAVRLLEGRAVLSMEVTR